MDVNSSEVKIKSDDMTQKNISRQKLFLTQLTLNYVAFWC